MARNRYPNSGRLSLSGMRWRWRCLGWLCSGECLSIFGICRGMQILNVALGGTLYQDVSSQLGADVLNHWQATPKFHSTHEVEVLDDSYLAQITDRQTVQVNSYHHQGIKG